MDGRGVPLSLIVTAANVNDGKRINEVLSAIVVERERTPMRRNKHLCADAGYRSAENVRIIEAHGYIPHVVDRRKEADIKPVLAGLRQHENIFPLDLVDARGCAGKSHHTHGQLAHPPRSETVADIDDDLALAIVVVIPPLLPAAAQFELPFALLDGREIDLVGGIGLCARCLQEECGA